MEGTRHERAALVGVAYFLGFLTTFIWLGYSSSTSTPSLPLEVTTPQAASVIEAVTPTPVDTAATAETATEPGVVSYENGILEVSALGGTRTLSFNAEVSGLETGEEFAEQGVHVGELAYVASPTGEYIFFCEQKSATADTCKPYVYDVLTDKIYPLSKDGERVDILTSAAATVAWNDSTLTVGGASSKDASKPWLLGN